MSAVDEIWADMKKSETIALTNLQQRVSKEKKTHNLKCNSEKQLNALLVGQLGTQSSSQNADKKIPSVKKKKLKPEANPQTDEVIPNQALVTTPTTLDPISITAQEMLLKISRDINLSSSEKDDERRKGLASLYKTLFIEYILSQTDYNIINREICKVILKRYGDSIEKCRELSYSITLKFFENSSDFGYILPYYIPALMQRLPSGLTYDEEMKVFVHDKDAHDAYRRGKAVDRQDKDGAINGILTHKVIETSEEIRLLACKTLYTLITRLCTLGASTVLHPYFQEIVIYIQAQLRDPHPDLKQYACMSLQYLAEQESFIDGMKFFAVGLVREILPVLRHRHARVRAAAVSALHVCVMVPDRDKRRGAGTEAIQDLVGFREENVLPVAGFYKADVQINYLAEIVCDSTLLVRERVVQMLTSFLTILEDRYDHQTRLLPYLLDLLTDEVESVASVALKCLKTCGQLYEEEHPDDIIEKRQYGVDGDKRMNFEKTLPKPFTERPRIGIRLFVRGNTTRFLKALMNELTNWTSRTRVKSAQLLKLIVVLCEEHLTMEAYSFLPTLVKAVNFANDDKDAELHSLLMEICELTGRYMVPDTFIHYLLPRLRGDADILTSNADSKYRLSVMESLRQLLDGVKPTLIPQHFVEIIGVITDPFVIDPESTMLRQESLQVIHVLLHSLCVVCRKKGITGIETDHFQSTGRLMTAFQSSLGLCFKRLVELLSHSDLRSTASSALRLLAEIEKGKVMNGIPCDGSVNMMFSRYGAQFLLEGLEAFDIDPLCLKSAELRLIRRLVDCPWKFVQQQSLTMEKLLLALVDFVGNASGSKHDENEFLLSMSELLCIALSLPVEHSQGDDTVQSVPVEYSQLVNKGPDGSYLIPTFDERSGLGEVVGVVQNCIPKLLNAFVFDTRWSRTQFLQRQRLLLLHRLLDDVMIKSYSSSSSSPSPGTDEDKSVATTRYLSDTHLTSGVAFNIIVTALKSCCQPSCVEAIRLSAVTLLRKLFETLNAQNSTNKSTVSKGRLLPFSKRSAEEVSEFGTLGVQLAIDALDDSSDEVGLEAIRCLYHMLPFVCKDGNISDNVTPTSNNNNNNMNNSTTNNKLNEMEESSITFSKFVRRVLKQGTVTAVPTASECMTQELDGVLRATAVLDPALFKSIVESNLDALSGIHRAPSVASDLYSGLLDHCELLLSLP